MESYFEKEKNEKFSQDCLPATYKQIVELLPLPSHGFRSGRTVTRIDRAKLPLISLDNRSVVTVGNEAVQGMLEGH